MTTEELVTQRDQIILGIGMQKTGTASLSAALTRLGFKA